MKKSKHRLSKRSNSIKSKISKDEFNQKVDSVLFEMRGVRDMIKSHNILSRHDLRDQESLAFENGMLTVFHLLHDLFIHLLDIAL